MVYSFQPVHAFTPSHVKPRLVEGEWLSVVAVAVTTSFVIAAVFEANLEKIYLAVVMRFFKRCDRSKPPARIKLNTAKMNVVVVGLSNLGRYVHDALMERHGITPLFVDFDEDRVREAKKDGFNAFLGDASDPDLWSRFGARAEGVFLVLCTMTHTMETRRVAAALKSVDYPGSLACVYRHLLPDEAAEFKGDIDAAAIFDLDREAAVGFVEEVCDSIVFPAPLEEAMYVAWDIPAHTFTHTRIHTHTYMISCERAHTYMNTRADINAHLPTRAPLPTQAPARAAA
jgi:hypothetical protein